MTNDNDWVAKATEYCSKYNIPLTYLPEIISDPKVIPMVRGKAFEFSAMLRLKEILPESDWIVDKPFMNAQFGIHDMDVRVIHKKTKKIIGIECKLAGKGSFRELKDGTRQIRVKCMRSRTLGDGKVNELAPKIGVSSGMLKVHNDQYVPTDFDVVLTSIANAFYDTDEETETFEWNPDTKGLQFLKQISKLSDAEKLQSFAYNRMYLADSNSLSITKSNGIICSRKQCPEPENCGFIPNYPLITFAKNSSKPERAWVEVSECEELFLNLINNRRNLTIFDREI